jgi:hypothetical protein
MLLGGELNKEAAYALPKLRTAVRAWGEAVVGVRIQMAPPKRSGRAA